MLVLPKRRNSERLLAVFSSWTNRPFILIILTTLKLAFSARYPVLEDNRWKLGISRGTEKLMKICKEVFIGRFVWQNLTLPNRSARTNQAK